MLLLIYIQYTNSLMCLASPAHQAIGKQLPRKMQANFGVEAGKFGVEASTTPTQ